MIPPFVAVPGAPHLVLPPGVHWATLAEAGERFGVGDRRNWLFEGVTAAAGALASAGCGSLYLDGSFVTSKIEPDDFDACWDPRGVNAQALDPLLLDFTAGGRRRQKRVYRGELYISGAPVGGGLTFLEFFMVEKHTGGSKGVIGIDLSRTGSTH